MMEQNRNRYDHGFRQGMQSMHGGDIYRNHVKLDFSVNINPLGLPEKVKTVLAEQMADLEHYPDSECMELREALAAGEQVKKEWILCGNGASELFRLAAEAIRPKTAMVTAPAFSGYEKALAGLETRVEYLMLRKEDGFALTVESLQKLHPGLDMLFLCSPNNPVGNCVGEDILKGALDYCEANGIYLVMDECFLGFVPEYEKRSMKKYLDGHPHLIIVSAFTKLYAMPGLRLGYAMSANEGLLEKMKLRQIEWSVSVAAQAAGTAALAEAEYVHRAVKLLARERVYLEQVLDSLHCRVFPGSVNFILFHTAKELYHPLLERGILIRDCSNFKGLTKGYYRIAVKDRVQNEKLAEALRDILGGGLADLGSDNMALG